MNIKEVSNDGLMIRLSMNFGKEDYAEKKKKALNKFRREAEIRGFRKGMAPMALVEKMHGGSALVDSINELISENLNNYIEGNQLSIIGEPLPVDNKDTNNDWANGENFEFQFDIALAPKFDISLSTEDKLTYYEVSHTAKSKGEYKAAILNKYASLEECDNVEEEGFVLANFEQGDKKVTETYISIKSITDDTVKQMFLGKKKGDSFDIDVVMSFPNETDRAAMLKMKREELDMTQPIWRLTIVKTSKYVDAKVDTKLFNQMFGENVVKTEEEFEVKLTEMMDNEFKQESDYRFVLDTREYLINKADIKLPEDFMKRWLFSVNEGKFSMEEIEKDFALFLKDFRWQSIAQRIMAEQKLEITNEALLDQAKKFAQYQFAMYGMSNIPEEHIVKYAQSILQNEKEGRRIYEKVEQDLVVDYIRSVVTIENKKISADKLRKMNE